MTCSHVPMARPSIFFLLPLVVIPVIVNVRADGSTFGFDLHHRFSNHARNWAQSMSFDVSDWPSEGTPGYYAALAAHDRARLRGRGLADLTFAGGNETTKYIYMGFLHYAEVELGTPGVTFLVALDTGSDLFWVPCDCTNCAPTSNSVYNLKFNIFNSSTSSTCERVPCSSSLCRLHMVCSAPTDGCPYQVRYLDNFSTSGILLQDVLHFTTDDIQRKPAQANVTFGCGRHQSEISEQGTPNGLLGLGVGKISVPTTLHDAGLITKNSFSLCFGRDGRGRLRFGDNGSPDYSITPFSPNSPTYIVTVSDVMVGGHSLKTGFSAIFDTGCSFTYLQDPVYSALTQQFDNFVDRERVSIDSRLSFEYCYRIGPNEAVISYPKLSFTMNGGKEFLLLHPLLRFRDESGNRGFCLAIMKMSEINLIGQNLMTGYKIVFDRDKLVLGWKEFDCYKTEESRVNSMAPTPYSSYIPAGPPSDDKLPQDQLSSVPFLLTQSLLSSILPATVAIANIILLLIIA